MNQMAIALKREVPKSAGKIRIPLWLNKAQCHYNGCQQKLVYSLDCVDWVGMPVEPTTEQRKVLEQPIFCCEECRLKALGHFEGLFTE
jgi:hypothetical protein